MIYSTDEKDINENHEILQKEIKEKKKKKKIKKKKKKKKMKKKKTTKYLISMKKNLFN